MSARASTNGLALALGLAFAAVHGCGKGEPPAPATAPSPGSPDDGAATAPGAEPAPVSPSSPSPFVDPPPMPVDVRYVVFGGVDGPSSNEVSIEDELLAVTKRLGPEGGVVLYGGGPGSHVRVRDAAPRGDALVAELAALFDPRPGRDSHYQPLRLAPLREGSLAALLDALDAGMQSDNQTRRLLVWIGGHGGPGDTARDVTIADWTRSAIAPRDLETPLAIGTRPVRFIQTTCFGGGFGETVLAMPARACGLFATTWDVAASGCDPDPARARDSYGTLLLGAMNVGANDLDKDGVVNPAEAHVAAAVASPGFEVPVLSSQQWLAREVPDGDERAHGSDDAPRAAADVSAEPALLEERALIAGIAARTGVAAADLPARFDALAADEEEKRKLADEAASRADLIRDGLAGELLARWPVLDDPWHPDFAATLAADRDAIAGALRDGATARRWREAEAAADAADVAVDAAQVAIAPFDRAMIARGTIERAAVARAGVEGSAWATFQALRSCEREPLP